MLKKMFIYRAWNKPNVIHPKGEEMFAVTSEESFTAAETVLDEALAEGWHFENISLHAEAWLLDEN